MQLHRVLAATLAAFFVVGCSSERSTSPIALASAGPKEKPSVEPSREAVDPAPPPKADPPPVATGSPPAQHEDPAKDTDEPPPPPDPYASVRGEWESYPEQVEGLLEPVVRAALHRAFDPKLHEHEKIAIAVIRLGTYKLPPLKPVAEKSLRTLVANAKDTEIAARAYLIAADSLLGGKGRLLAAAYEQLIDQGTEIPSETRTQLAELIQWEEPEKVVIQGPEDLTGVITAQAGYVRTKLLEESLWGHNLFFLALPIERLGKAVMNKRHLTRTFHDLLMALPEPQRTDLLMQLAWSPKQEKALDREREKLKKVEPSLANPVSIMMMPENRPPKEEAYLKELEAIAANRRAKFRALEEERRDTIEGCFANVDAPGWRALVAINVRLAELQVVLDKIVTDLGPDISYRFKPLVPADAPRDAASNVLSKMPLPGSVEDRLPTIIIRDHSKPKPGKPNTFTWHDYKIEFDAPAGRPSHAEVVKPGNVLVGTFWLNDARTPGGLDATTTYQAELHIAAIVEKLVRGTEPRYGIKENVVQGELVVTPSNGDRESLPFEGWLTPTGFRFEAPWKWEFPMPGESTTLIGSLDKGGPLTGDVRRGGIAVGGFAFVLKK